MGEALHAGIGAGILAKRELCALGMAQGDSNPLPIRALAKTISADLRHR